MPHIDITLYDFLTDLQGLVPDDPGMAWISFDGDPAVGCMQASRVSGGPTVITAIDTTQTWETLGVPPGSYVTGITDLGVNGKLLSPSAAGIANVGVQLEFQDMAGNHIFSYPGIGFGGATVGAWFSDPGGDCGPTARGRASNTPLKIVMTATLVPTNLSFTVTVRTDTWRIRILYQDTNIGSCCDLHISPLGPTVLEGATQLFTATGDSTPVTWSTVWGSIDAGGLYTAPGFIVTDTVTATSIADPTCNQSTFVHVEEPVPGFSAQSDSKVSSHATLRNAGSPIGGGNALHARSAGVVAHAVLTAAQNACLEVYFAGVDNGDDFTIMAYSAPTELCLLNPVAGHEYILEAPAADLARFLGKRMGNVEFRRAGAGGNYTGDILLRAIELYYKTRTT